MAKGKAGSQLWPADRGDQDPRSRGWCGCDPLWGAEKGGFLPGILPAPVSLQAAVPGGLSSINLVHRSGSRELNFLVLHFTSSLQRSWWKIDFFSFPPHLPSP